MEGVGLENGWKSHRIRWFLDGLKPLGALGWGLARRELGGARCSPLSNDWVLEVGDLITARCSPEGVVAMRRFPGVYALRGLHCHQALGGRRHERRLYESVVADGSALVGASLEELLSLPATEVAEVEVPWCVQSFRGYPLAASRREAADPEARPLEVSEPLQPGDVLLIDAFEDFPGLEAARRLFLISGLVPRSRAPRHGRATDMWRGAMAVGGLIVALVLDLQKRCNILVSTMVVAGMLLVTSGVKPNQIAAQNSASEDLPALRWPRKSWIGTPASRSAVARASPWPSAAAAPRSSQFRSTSRGLQWGLAQVVIRIHDIGGMHRNKDVDPIFCRLS